MLPHSLTNQLPNKITSSLMSGGGTGGGPTTGKAVNFGAGSDVAGNTLNHTINNTVRQFSVACSFRVNTAQANTTNEYIWAIVNSSTTNQMIRFLIIHNADNTFNLTASYTNTTTQPYASTTNLDVGTEYRMVFVEEDDATDRNLYIGGTLDTNWSSSRALPSMDYFSIGGTGDTTPQFSLDVDIWDVAVYSKAMTTTDVANDFDTPSQLPYLAGDADLLSTDLEGYWPCNEASGNLIDRSSESVNLVASGSPTYEAVTNSFIQVRATS